MKRTISLTLEVEDGAKAEELLRNLPDSITQRNEMGRYIAVTLNVAVAYESRPGGEDTESGGKELI